jgi:hypothetical protein
MITIDFQYHASRLIPRAFLNKACRMLTHANLPDVKGRLEG